MTVQLHPILPHQPMADGDLDRQVLTLHAEGRTVPQICETLDLTREEVMETLGLDYYCPSCGNWHGGKWIDTGIGSYEYWGARLTYVNWQYVCQICEGDIVDANGNPVDGDRFDSDPFAEVD